MRGLERRFDAHVTADLTEQWMLVSLPRGIELEALGDLQLGPPVADGPAQSYLVLSSSGQRLLLAKESDLRGPVQLFGRFDPPVRSGTPLVVEEAVSVARQ